MMVFNNMITDKMIPSEVMKCFLSDGKQDISPVFITQSY